MNIRVKGGSRAQKKLADLSALYCAGVLMSTRKLTGIELKIRIRPNLLAKQGLYGSCIWCDSNVRPRVFEIEVERDLDEYNFVETICHEMVHLKQYATDQMRERYRPMYRLYWFDMDCTDLEYEEHPWELEAELMQTPLALGFMAYKYGNVQ